MVNDNIQNQETLYEKGERSRHDPGIKSANICQYVHEPSAQWQSVIEFLAMQDNPKN